MRARLSERIKRMPSYIGGLGLLRIIIIVVALAVAFIVVLLWPIVQAPDWMGFGPDKDYPPSSHVGLVLPAKTLWDWLQLIIVPVSVASLVAWFNWRDKLQDERQHKQDQEREERQHKQDQEREESREQEATLDGYLDRMGSLMLDTPLRAAYTDRTVDAARDLARARTVTAMHRLDGSRNRSLLHFLQEAELIKKARPIVDLREANLSDTDLREANLSDTDLSRADLSGADLRGADLNGANLSGADLRADLRLAKLHGAKLHDANLNKANLRQAELNVNVLDGLREANLRGANLQGAFLDPAWLSGADLRGAQLEGAHMSFASLRGAQLEGARLHGADLDQTDLHGANLRGALGITAEQIKLAKNWQAAIYDDATWDVLDPSGYIRAVRGISSQAEGLDVK